MIQGTSEVRKAAYPIQVDITALTEIVGEMTQHYKEWAMWHARARLGQKYGYENVRLHEEAGTTTAYANTLRVMTGLDWYSRMQDLTNGGWDDFDPDRIKYTLCDMYEDGELPRDRRTEDYLD